MLLLTALLACTPSGGGERSGGPSTDAPSNATTTTSTPTEPGVVDPFAPGPATLHRLTDPQWRNAVADLVGVQWDGPLPQDLAVVGYTRIGATALAVAPLDLEQYETAAWAIAEAVAPTDEAAADLLGCTPDAACVRAWATGFTRQAWRRPVHADEVDALVHRYEEIALLLGSEALAVQSALASVLLDPAFVYRVELGEPDPADATRLRYTDHEMATRLSFLLWDTTPDAELLAAADAGLLTDSAELRAQAGRMLEDSRARPALGRFFAEWMNLSRLEQVDKDASLFPEWTPELRAAMTEEATRLFEDVALADRGFDELFVTSEGYANDRLGEIYGLYVPSPEVQPVVLPPAHERGGILGRAAFLALNAHATATSPTLRGKYVRTRLLCIDIPPPPEGVITSLDALGDVEGTLRDRLELHMTEPVCAGCHTLMDPIGFGFEHFDPVGRRRELDAGYPVDASVELDGAAGYGAEELARLVTESPLFTHCVATQLFRHGTGRLELEGDLAPILDLEDGFVDTDLRFTELSECTDGEVRDCSTECGDGQARCERGRWTVCDAPEPAVEDCNGVDDDCDGAVDEAVERACDTMWGPGTESCADGAWTECDGPPPPPETCNGLDDDGDGLIDEDIDVDLVDLSFAGMADGHEACDAAFAPVSGACRAAANRICGARDCSVTGWGMVARDVGASTATLACLSADEAIVHETSFTALQAHHGGCLSHDPVGPDCNAAINRWCASIGERTGFGPLEHSGDVAFVACLPRATTFPMSFSELARHAPGCDGAGERMGPTCDIANHLWCREQGFATGYGPLENSGDTSHAACVGVR
jgi:hypothetical protein